jgi:hypothetical protein
MQSAYVLFGKKDIYSRQRTAVLVSVRTRTGLAMKARAPSKQALWISYPAFRQQLLSRVHATA